MMVAKQKEDSEIIIMFHILLPGNIGFLTVLKEGIQVRKSVFIIYKNDVVFNFTNHRK